MLDNRSKTSFTLAEKIGSIALVFAFFLYFNNPFGSIVILSFFLLLCFAAPFIPWFGFFLPVISRGRPGMAGIAITFDDGPSPLSTPIVLDLLARHKLQATFFVVGEKAVKYPELIENIIDQGHTLGNHSWNHDYYLMLRSPKTLAKDIHNTQKILFKSGIRPLLFRPPAGITGPRLAKVLAREGLTTVTYSCRAFDRGNRNIHNLAGKILKQLKPADIVMLHDLPPHQKNQLDQWKNELDILFAALAKNHRTVSLEQIIEQPVMLTESI